LELLKKAIAKIPDNYPSFPFRLSGFYRLIGTKEKKIIDLSEAVFDIYLENYFAKDRQFKLIKSRVDKDLTAFNGNDDISMGWKPSGVMNLDLVSTIKEWALITEDGIKDHRFIYKGLVNYNGKEAFEIEYEPRQGVKEPLLMGNIFLDADDLAFLEVREILEPEHAKYFNWSFMQSVNFKLSHINARISSDSLVITYRKYGGKYYLNHVNKKSKYYFSGTKEHFLLDPLTVSTNCLVTRIDTAGLKPFSKEESMGNRLGIEQQSQIVNDTRDSPDRSDTSDVFWVNYNTIAAEFNVDSAIRVIQINNATLNYKRLLEAALPKYPKDKVARIDSILSFYHRKDQFNGTALVQYDGKVIYEKGLGMADKERNIPNKELTQFRIGSTSKQFTSMLIMQLVSEHKISLNDTAGKFLPGYANGKVTIQQLLTHQSGIPNYTESDIYFPKIITRKYSPDELVYQFCSDSLEFPPGTKFNYSNSGYVVLADIIEKITGKEYADVLAERIFIPLGMKNSYFAKRTGLANTTKSGTPSDTSTILAIGYMNGLPENFYPVENVIGAGGITSNAEDLLRWANALSTEVLLPKELMDELFRPRVEWPELDAWYGYGWMIDRYAFQVSRNHKVQYHPGTELGFYDMLLRQPDKGIVIILLNNTGDFPRFDMTDLILKELD